MCIPIHHPFHFLHLHRHPTIPLVVVDDVPVNVVATFEEVADVPEPDPDDVPEPDPDELDDPDPDELDDPVVEPADEVTRPKLKGVIGPVSCPWL